MRQLSIAEVLRIIRRVTGQTVYHVEMTFHSDCEEYICRRS